MAAKPTISGTITSLVMVKGDAPPSFGDTISFTVESSSQLFINVLAHQDGVLVMNSWAPFFPNGEPGEYGLYSPVWQSGAADCIANLVHVNRQGKYETVDTFEFSVSA